MKNHLIKIFILLFIASQGLVAEEKPIIADDDAASIEEKKETYIEELVEDFEEIPGFFITFRDPEKNKIFLKINKDQLNNEFIYFAHALNGVASSGKVKGSYLDEGIFKIEKGFRIAQMVLCPVIKATFKEVDILEETERGVGGFGSTGQ